jgi:Rrf2 family protein
VLSQTAEYAIRAAVALAGEPGRSLTTRDLADQTKVPAGYLSKVLQALGRAGLVKAQRGLGGGFALARSPAEMSLLDVINAVDPIQRITRCPLGLDSHRARLCSVHRRIDAGIAMVEALFAATSLAELVHESETARPLCEDISPAVTRP